LGVGDLFLAGHHQRHSDDPGLRLEDDRRAQGRPVKVHGPHEEDGHQRVHTPDDGGFTSNNTFTLNFDQCILKSLH
jgi:hypothetical protein